MKSKRGGRRKGAGRPKADGTHPGICIRAPRHLRERWSDLIKDSPFHACDVLELLMDKAFGKMKDLNR